MTPYHKMISCQKGDATTISAETQFLVRSREMWCEMKEPRMGHTWRISHSGL